jgi:hypothetical protein
VEVMIYREIKNSAETARVREIKTLTKMETRRSRET